MCIFAGFQYYMWSGRTLSLNRLWKVKNIYCYPPEQILKNNAKYNKKPRDKLIQNSKRYSNYPKEGRKAETEDKMRKDKQKTKSVKVT